MKEREGTLPVPLLGCQRKILFWLEGNRMINLWMLASVCQGDYATKT